MFSANYVPGFSLNVKSSFLDRNCFITNEGEGLSSISINKSYVTDNSIVDIYSESPNIVKRIYLPFRGDGRQMDSEILYKGTS